ncbi:MAG: dienelactone hydrolase family protein [Deltaproteobacteria bacterium]|nr:dienelactone hydrolase family protein [Deltaproteobacteria bacterium]
MKQMLPFLLVLVMAFSAQAKMVTQAVEYQQDGTVLEGHLAYDDAFKGKRPGVMVVHEFWGLNDYAKKRAEQVAALGYVAFACDLYGKGVVTKDPKEAAGHAAHLRGTPLLRQRARAGLDVLAKHKLVDPPHLAALGYCLGGTTVLELGYSGAGLKGVASFHGGLSVPKPEDKAIKAKILVMHGADDPLIKSEEIAAFQEAMRKTGADWQMIYYGGAVHSFTNPDADKAGVKGVAYNAAADRRSWQHLKDFLKELFSSP